MTDIADLVERVRSKGEQTWPEYFNAAADLLELIPRDIKLEDCASLDLVGLQKGFEALLEWAEQETPILREDPSIRYCDIKFDILYSALTFPSLQEQYRRKAAELLWAALRNPEEQWRMISNVTYNKEILEKLEPLHGEKLVSLLVQELPSIESSQNSLLEFFAENIRNPHLIDYIDKLFNFSADALLQLKDSRADVEEPRGFSAAKIISSTLLYDLERNNHEKLSEQSAKIKDVSQQNQVACKYVWSALNSLVYNALYESDLSAQHDLEMRRKRKAFSGVYGAFRELLLSDMPGKYGFNFSTWGDIAKDNTGLIQIEDMVAATKLLILHADSDYGFPATYNQSFKKLRQIYEEENLAPQVLNEITMYLQRIIVISPEEVRQKCKYNADIELSNLKQLQEQLRFVIRPLVPIAEKNCAG